MTYGCQNMVSQETIDKQTENRSKSNGEENVKSKATRSHTMLRDQEKKKDNWHYRIHVETKVEMGRSQL